MTETEEWAVIRGNGRKVYVRTRAPFTGDDREKVRAGRRIALSDYFPIGAKAVIR